VTAADARAHQGFLIEEQGMTSLADSGPETALTPLQQAACTYRVALGPRAGQKVLSLQALPTEPPPTPVRCVNEQGFSLHGEVCCAAHDERKKLEHLCRYGVLAPNATLRPEIIPSSGRQAGTSLLCRASRARRSTPIPPQPTTPRRPLPRRRCA